MIFPDHPSRALWLDFDTSQTFNEGQMTERQKEWMEEEVQLVIELGEDMVCCLLCTLLLLRL